MYSRGATANGFLFFAKKVSVPSLPVVKLFGKMAVRAEQRAGTQLDLYRETLKRL